MHTGLLIISSLLSVVTCLTDIVQREGSNTTMSCKLESSNWTSCVFKHHDPSEAECALLPDQGNLQPCGGSSLEETQIQITEDGEYCQLLFRNVHVTQTGQWECQVIYSNQSKSSQAFQLSVLVQPSHIDFQPESEIYKYFEDAPFKANLQVQNVAPKPKVVWSMSNNSIDGVHYIDTKVTNQSQTLKVEESLTIPMMKSIFNGKSLQYELRIAVVDEFGNLSPEEDYVQEGEVTLKCKDCETPSTTSPSPITTTTSTTTATTNEPTSLSTIQETSPSTSTTSSQTSTSSTTSTTTTTTTNPPSTTTTEVPEIPCRFNLTDLSGSLNWPLAGARCDEETKNHPEWIMSIMCHGNCLDTINIVFDDMGMDNEASDPCATQLLFESVDNFTKTMYDILNLSKIFNFV